MHRTLNIKNKLGFIDGTITKPPNTSDPLYAPWECCNDMIIAWIQHSVSSDLRSSIAHADTAESVLNDLKERFSIQNAPRIFQLAKSIFSSTQDSDSISQYHNKLKTLWDELEICEPMPTCTCGAVKTLLDYTHTHKLMQFLIGLDDSYDSVRAQSLLQDPLPPLNRVLSLVQQEERRQQLHSIPTPLAMATKTSEILNQRHERLFCSHYNIPGHSLEHCFKANPNLPIYSHCHIPGHMREKCYKLNGFPPGHKNSSKYKSNANQSSLVQEEINHGPSLTPEQYSQLIALLNPTSSNANTPTANNVNANSLPMFGLSILDDDWSGDGL
ncbi:uncharacterized protein LOC121246612 [Juglans microcarpa x Juglans regia]|uniref:uncharacterized protein LOC121246612 n=1 Tax=Juglans microcarpa x Juglans regia TaxID=2249226 RepID=UPI001B7ED993|nr:uncharacterized protein LOC121246612 [Juglans microcarpa x Juglans regia]